MSGNNMRIALMALAASVALAGCQSSRLGGLDTRSNAPAPLTPAPSGQVTSGQLPPPAQPTNNPSSFPDAPGSENTTADGQPELNPDGTPVDDANAGDDALNADDNSGSQSSVQQVASAQPVTREALVGAWKVSTSGSSCQMFMALTQWSGGYRAASRGCPGDAASVSAWDVSGSQVVLKDSSGNTVATLFSGGNNSYSGQTSGGRAITLSR